MDIWMHRTSWLVIITMLMLPGATAGTQANPEMRCPPGDVSAYPGVPLTGPVAAALDWRAIWFDGESNHSIQANIRVQALDSLKTGSSNPEAATWYEVGFDFSSAMDAHPSISDWSVRARHEGAAGSESGVWSFWLLPYGEDNRSQLFSIEGYADWETHIIHMVVPRALLGNPPRDANITPLHGLAWQTFPYPLNPASGCREPATSFTFELGPEPEVPEECMGNESCLAPVQGPSEATPHAGAVSALLLLVSCAFGRRVLADRIRPQA